MKQAYLGLLLAFCFLGMQAMEDPNKGEIENFKPRYENGQADEQNQLIHRAALENDVKKIEHCITNGGASINQTDRSGHTPLDAALSSKNYETIIWLIEHGATVNRDTLSAYGAWIAEWYPLISAVLSNDTVWAQWQIEQMLNNPYPLNSPVQELNYMFPLMIALDQQELIAYVLDNANFLIKRPDTIHRALVTSAATGHVMALDRLLILNPEHNFESMQTVEEAVYWAALQGYSDSACALVKRKNVSMGTLSLILARLQRYLDSQIESNGRLPDAIKQGMTMLIDEINIHIKQDIIIAMALDQAAAVKKYFPWLVTITFGL